MTNPTVSIIIPTRNRPSLLRHCLEHVLAQPYPHKELIVVDSSSNDESEQVVAQYPEVISVRLKGQRNNRPQAKNEGIAVSSGSIIAFVDDDAMVQPGWFDALSDTYRDETVGAVGGRVIEAPKPHCDLVTGSPGLSIMPSGRIILRNLGAASTDQVDVDWLPGGNMSFRRTILGEVGGFDPAFTLINLREEADLCLRMKKAGWRVVFNPAMAVVHGSLSSSIFRSQNRPLIHFFAGRNTTYLAIKHFGLNPYTLTCQLILAPARTCGLTVYHAGLLSTAALAHTMGCVVGLVAGIQRLISRRRHTELAPKILQPDQPMAAQLSCAVLNKRGTPWHTTFCSKEFHDM